MTFTMGSSAITFSYSINGVELSPAGYNNHDQHFIFTTSIPLYVELLK